MLHRKSRILAGDESHGQAVISLECALECIEIKLASLIIVSLSLFKINPINCSLDESWRDFFIELFE